MRGWVIAVCAAVAVSVVVSFLSAWVSHADGSAVPSGPGGEPVTDAYMFVHRPLAGDGTLTARVTSLSGAHTTLQGGNQEGSPLQPGVVPWAKAGILLEPDTMQGTRYAAVMVTGAHGVRMQFDYAHDRAGLPGAAGHSPRWLRLTRAGDAVTSYDSADGVHWTRIGTIRLPGLPRTAQIGLFVTSPVYIAPGAAAGSPSVATASFDHVSDLGDLSSGAWAGTEVAGRYPYPSPSSASGWQQRSASSFAITGSGDIAPLVGGTVFSHWAGASIVNGTIFGLLFVIVFGALFGTPECRHGRALAVRAAGAGLVAFSAGAVATAIAEWVTRRVLAANGNYLFPQSWPDVARVILGTGLFLGLAAALVVALGAMLRRRSLTVLAGFVLLLLPGILGTATPLSSHTWLMRFTPTAAFAVQATLPRTWLVNSAYIPANGYFPIGPWASLAVLAAYTAAAMAAGEWILNRRSQEPNRLRARDPRL